MLLAAGQLARRPVEGECLAEMLGFIGKDAVIDQRIGGQFLDIAGIDGVPQLRALANLDVGLRRLVLRPERRVPVIGRRRRVDAFRAGARDTFGNDAVGFEIGQRQADPVGICLLYTSHPARAFRGNRFPDRGGRTLCQREDAARARGG